MGDSPPGLADHAPAPTPPAGPRAAPGLRWTRLVVLSVLVIYLAGVTADWYATPDSALYLGLARSLAEGHGYRFNEEAHSLVTPGFPALLAALQLIFGFSYLVPNVVMCLCGLLALLFIWLSVRQLADPRAAWLVTLAAALSYPHFHYSHLILTDVPFVLTFWVSVYCILRFQRGAAWWLVPACVAVIAGLLIRLPGLLLLGPLAVGLCLDRASPATLRRRFAGSATLLAAVAILALVLFFIVRPMVTGQQSYAVHYANFMTARAAEKGSLFFLKDFLIALRILPGAVAELLTGQDALWPIGILICLLAVVGSVRWWLAGKRFLAVISPLFFVQLAVITRAIYNDRYLLPIQPLVLLAALEGLDACLQWLAHLRRRALAPGTPRVVAVAFVGFLIVVNVPRVARDAFYYSTLSHTGRYHDVVRGGKFNRYFAIADALRAQAPAGVAFVRSQDATILHWLSRWRTVRLPKTDRETEDDARLVYRAALREAPRDACIVLDLPPAKPEYLPYRDTVTRLFAADTARFEFVSDARGALIYRARTDPPSKSRAPSSQKPRPPPAGTPAAPAQ